MRKSMKHANTWINWGEKSSKKISESLGDLREVHISTELMN